MYSFAILLAHPKKAWIEIFPCYFKDEKVEDGSAQSPIEF